MVKADLPIRVGKSSAPAKADRHPFDHVIAACGNHGGAERVGLAAGEPALAVKSEGRAPRIAAEGHRHRNFAACERHQRAGQAQSVDRLLLPELSRDHLAGVDMTHDTVLFWRTRFEAIFAAAIRCVRVQAI